MALKEFTGELLANKATVEEVRNCPIILNRSSRHPRPREELPSIGKAMLVFVVIILEQTGVDHIAKLSREVKDLIDNSQRAGLRVVEDCFV